MDSGTFDIGIWLMQQAPVIVVMGVVIWWLSKRYTEKDKQLETLAKDFIELSVKWHTLMETGIVSNKEDAKEIIKKLEEIHDVLIKGRK